MVRRTALLSLGVLLGAPPLAAQLWSRARSCLADAPADAVSTFALRVAAPDSANYFCSRLRDGTSVCATLTQYAAYNDSGTLTVNGPHGGQRRWPVVARRRWQGDTADLEAFEADIAGNGNHQLVIAALEMVAGGLGISHWNIWVLGDDPAVPPQELHAQEYDSRGSWVRFPGHHRCYFLATDWRILNIDRRRGEGTYFYGALRPVVGGFVADSALPLVRIRRRLYSFGTERDIQPPPLGLLLDRRGQTLPAQEAATDRVYP